MTVLEHAWITHQHREQLPDAEESPHHYAQFVASTPPCLGPCPAGEDCRAFLTATASGDLDRVWEAWRCIVEVNPLPAIIGCVCYHPCQLACFRARGGQAVAIAAVERYIGDSGIEGKWELPAPMTHTDLTALVVGSGPLGLSVAYHLYRAGFHVTVREAQRKLGGMMRYGITRARLPERILDAEIDRLARAGIAMHSHSTVLRPGDELAHYDVVVFGGGGGGSMALASSGIIWKQPAHTERRKKRTVTAAVGRGRKVAESVCDYFGLTPAHHMPDVWQRKHFPALERSNKRTVRYRQLRPQCFPDYPSSVDPSGVSRDESGHRIIGVNPQLDRRRALAEAQRCMSCGSCMDCHLCEQVCPHHAIEIDEGGKYRIRLDRCAGCPVCVAACPSGALEVVAGQHDQYIPVS